MAVREILVELKKSVVRWENLARIILLVVLLLISNQEMISILQNKGSSDIALDVIGVFNGIILIERFKTVFFLVISSVYATAFCKEYRSDYARYYIKRSGAASYVWTKILAIVASGLAVYGASVLIYSCILLRWMPFVTTAKIPFYSDSTFIAMESMNPRQHPYLWMILSVFLVGLSLVSLCVVAFCVSLYYPDPILTMCIPSVLYFFGNMLNEKIPISFIQMGNHSFLVTDLMSCR